MFALGSPDHLGHSQQEFVLPMVAQAIQVEAFLRHFSATNDYGQFRSPLSAVEEYEAVSKRTTAN